MNIKLRYKEPDGNKSKLLQYPLPDKIIAATNTSENFRFASAVAEFGLLLRNSKYKGNSSFTLVKNLAQQSLGEDKQGYRQEFIGLVDKAAVLEQGKETAKTKQ